MRAPFPAALILLLTLFAQVSLASGEACLTVYRSENTVVASQIVMVERLGHGISSQASIVQSSFGKSVFLRSLHVDAPLQTLRKLRPDEKSILQKVAALPVSDLRRILAGSDSQKDTELARIGLKSEKELVSITSYEAGRLQAVKEVALIISELRLNFDYLKRVGQVLDQGRPFAPEARALVVDPETGVPVGILIALVPGKDLAHLVERRQINRQQVQFVKEKVLQLLAALHQQGLIHGDLTPANIMVDLSAGGQPSVRLIDFMPPETSVFKEPALEKIMFESFLVNLLRKNPLYD